MFLCVVRSLLYVLYGLILIICLCIKGKSDHCHFLVVYRISVFVESKRKTKSLEVRVVLGHTYNVFFPMIFLSGTTCLCT